MLTRDYDVDNSDRYVRDSLDQKPTLAHSVYDNLAAGFVTPFVAADELAAHFGGTPVDQSAIDTLGALNQVNANPRMGNVQSSLNYVSNLIGMAMNPITGALVRGGAALAGGVSRTVGLALPTATTAILRTPLAQRLAAPISKYVPESIGIDGAEKPLTSALIGEKGLAAFTEGAGVGVPQAITDNYNADNKSINWGGVARDMGNMGAFGLSIGSVPFVYGVLRGRINRALPVETAETELDRVKKAFDQGTITKDEHDWLTDYLTNPLEAKDLQARGSKILKDNGFNVDSVNHEVPIPFVENGDIHNLNAAMVDQLASNVPDEHKRTLSNYVIQNSLDKINDDPKIADGLRGYYDFIKEKLDAKPEKLAESDQILSEYLLKGANNDLEFSQSKIFKMAKKFGFEASHLDNLPCVVPVNITRHIRLLGEITRLKQKLPNKQTARRIAEIEKSLPKILTPKEELSHLTNEFLGKPKLPENWQTSANIHRLYDLAEVWKNARTLLDRIKIQHEYERQESFANLVQGILQIKDSNSGKLSDPTSVAEYLRQKISGQVSDTDHVGELNKMIKDNEKIPTESKQIIEEQTRLNDVTNAKEIGNEYIAARDKFTEFEKSENIFKSLIMCAMGKIANG